MMLIKVEVSDNIDMALLAQSGCIEVQVSLESASEIILNNMNKR